MKRLIIRTTARADVLRQVEYYLDEDAYDAASRFPHAVEAAVQRIQELPGIGRAEEFESSRLKGLRSWQIPGFETIRVYYVETADAIRVIRILHGMRDLPHILESDAT